jgi:7-carboxy-7-deazaguanine synthase (Cx14CxxC type)
MYAVKELYLTLQGEGYHVGRPAVFVRFAGCNLWSGREEDRAGAVCRFCDTDFFGTDGANGGRYPTAESLARACAGLWPPESAAGRFVVCTGGEPLLQLDPPLLAALHHQDFEVAIETNGTLAVPPGVDWVCVSPKAGAELVVTSGDELKLVHPQDGAEPERFEGLGFQRFSLQPMDGPRLAENTELVLEYAARHPRWRVSLQMHKVVGIR